MFVLSLKRRESLARLLIRDSDTHLALSVFYYGPAKGLGVRAAKDFDPGEFVVEYAGKLIQGRENIRETFMLRDKEACYTVDFKSRRQWFW